MLFSTEFYLVGFQYLVNKLHAVADRFESSAQLHQEIIDVRSALKRDALIGAKKARTAAEKIGALLS